MNKSAMPIKAKPYDHQIKAFSFVCERLGISHSAALLMEMGTGKTITTIAVIGALYNVNRITKVLIICPLSITGVWSGEFDKFADFDYDLTVLAGSTEQKISKLRTLTDNSRLQIVIVNYESAWRVEKALTAWNPDIIVCDEGHKIKSHSAAQSKAVHRLGAKAQYKMLLTGTLITNKALDVFSQFKFLDPAIFGGNFYSFRNKYFDMTGYGNYTPVLKRSMESDLISKIHAASFRVTKTECLDLPDTTDIIRNIDLEPPAMKTYNALVKHSFAELSKGEVTAANILSKLLRLSQLTGGFLSDDEGHTTKVSAAKLNALEDIIDEALNEDKKIVVIARFIAEIEAIQKLLSNKKMRYSVVMGGIKDREAQIAAFQTDPDVTVFVGQIATAGLGITLTAASTMVFYSLDYSMSNFEQAKARIHRVGQKQNCTYVHLVAKGTVDEKVLQTLRDKADLAKTLVDDYRNNKNPFESGG